MRYRVDVWEGRGGDRTLAESCVVDAHSAYHAVLKVVTQKALPTTQWEGPNPRYVLRPTPLDTIPH